MRKQISILALSAILAAPAFADVVKLTDGSSLTGPVTQLDNGDVKVATGAGDITVAKDKIARIVTEGTSSGGGSNAYVEGVLERRRAFGNEDGVPRAENLQGDQLMLTLGQLNYTGDAFSATASDLAGLSYGLAWAHSYTDFVAAEIWGDYSYASKDYSAGPSTATLKLQRYNVGAGPKLQYATRLGRVERNVVLIPNIGLSAVWSGANGDVSGSGITGTSFNSSSFGAALSGGLDLQFGGALIAFKARYLLTSDVSGTAGLKSTNTSAFIPQVGVGFSF